MQQQQQQRRLTALLSLLSLLYLCLREYCLCARAITLSHLIVFSSSILNIFVPFFVHIHGGRRHQRKLVDLVHHPPLSPHSISSSIPGHDQRTNSKGTASTSKRYPPLESPLRKERAFGAPSSRLLQRSLTPAYLKARNRENDSKQDKSFS